MNITQERSLTEYLTLIKPFVSAQLIDEGGWEEINQIAQQLPSQMTNFFGFECRLGTAAPKADFLLCISSGERGQEFLDESQTTSLFPENLLQKPVWSQLKEFVTSWRDPCSPLHDKVHNIWLEFDLPIADPCSLPPSCFFGSSSIRASSENNPNANRWVTQTAIPLLQGSTVSPDLEKQVLSCIEALPDTAYVFQVGLMLARQSNLIRLCIRGIAASELGDYLQAVQWSGSTEALEEKIMSLSSFVDRVDLNIDIGEAGVAPKIGLECYLLQQPKFQPKWQQFLDYLIKTELCLPLKKEALLNYPGFVREKNNRYRWPSHLRTISDFMGSGYESIIIRGIHHIKLRFQQQDLVEAKAYGWVNHKMVGPKTVQNLRPSRPSAVQIQDFLTPEEHQDLLKFVLENEADFVHSQVGNNDHHKFNPFYRNSLVYHPQVPKLSAWITERIRSKFLEILSQLQFPEFELAYIETQITAHNDGHYYKLHTDNSMPELAGRQITFVYYFYQEPKPFSGGELKVFGQDSNQTSPVSTTGDLFAPLNNSIIFFPSHYPHEVLPVSCPAATFAASRFSVNGWLWRSLEE